METRRGHHTFKPWKRQSSIHSISSLVSSSSSDSGARVASALLPFELTDFSRRITRSTALCVPCTSAARTGDDTHTALDSSHTNVLSYICTTSLLLRVRECGRNLQLGQVGKEGGHPGGSRVLLCLSLAAPHHTRGSVDVTNTCHLTLHLRAQRVVLVRPTKA